MAIAHLVPGYDDYLGAAESSRRTSRLLDAAHLRTDAAGLPSADYVALAQMRSWAKQQWTQPKADETTYGAEYGQKTLHEPTRAIRSELDRRNRPHPPAIFMTNSLHYVPGYHSADASVGKEPYRVDQAVSFDEKRYRDGLKGKYNGSRTVAAIRQFEPFEEETVSSYGNAGRLPYHSTKDRERVRNALGVISNAASSSIDSYGQRLGAARRHIDSAGPEERSTIEEMLARATRTSRSGFPNLMIPHGVNGTTESRRQDDITGLSQVSKPLFRYLPPRGDFLIHPAWPPSLRHHTVPGFVS